MVRGSWSRGIPLALLATCVSCAHVPTQSESVKMAKIDASTSELRTRLVEAGRDILRATEVAADSIDAATTDPSIRRNTLLWRLCSVPAATEAVLREDPIVATLDITAYRDQLLAFLDSPNGMATFGPGTGFARREIARLGADWERTAEIAGVHMSDQTRTRFDAWVAAHPIEGVPFTRPSVVNETAKLMSVQNGGIGAAVGGMQETLERLELRVSLANEFALKQGVWLARLAVMDAGDTPDAGELRGTLRSTRGLVNATPDLLARERQALLADIDRQRQATLAALAEEREILLRAARGERTIVLDAVDEQRRRTMQEVDSLRVRTVSDAYGLVDHVLVRVALLLGGLVLAGAVGLWLSRRRAPAAAASL
jgi:hypothetical protein